MLKRQDARLPCFFTRKIVDGHPARGGGFRLIKQSRPTPCRVGRDFVCSPWVKMGRGLEAGMPPYSEIIRQRAQRHARAAYIWWPLPGRGDGLFYRAPRAGLAPTRPALRRCSPLAGFPALRSDGKSRAGIATRCGGRRPLRRGGRKGYCLAVSLQHIAARSKLGLPAPLTGMEGDGRAVQRSGGAQTGRITLARAPTGMASSKRMRPSRASQPEETGPTAVFMRARAHCPAIGNGRTVSSRPPCWIERRPQR